MSQSAIVMRCGHCYKQVHMKVHGSYVQQKDGGDVLAKSSTTWQLLECSACHAANLLQSDDHEIPLISHNKERTADLVYPSVATRTPVGHLPRPILHMFNEALKVQDVSPSACAVLIGRILEAVCKQEGAAGKTLAEQLNDLLESTKIQERYSKMAHNLRHLRNLGAHFDPVREVRHDDVPVMLEFVEAILEMVYDAPAKIKALETRLAKSSSRTEV